MKKLYRVDIKTSYYAMADDETEAESLVDGLEISCGLSHATTITSRIVRSNESLAYGWQEDDTVYSTSDDITLGEAMDEIE